MLIKCVIIVANEMLWNILVSVLAKLWAVTGWVGEVCARIVRGCGMRMSMSWRILNVCVVG